MSDVVVVAKITGAFSDAALMDEVVLAIMDLVLKIPAENIRLVLAKLLSLLLLSLVLVAVVALFVFALSLGVVEGQGDVSVDSSSFFHVNIAV